MIFSPSEFKHEVDKRVAKAKELHHTPLELIDRIYEVLPLLWENCSDAQMGERAQMARRDAAICGLSDLQGKGQDFF